MERRTLLKSMLAVPVAVSAADEPSGAAPATGTLFSGLAGLDYALGGLEQGNLACIVGPPCMGKTLLLLELASRIVRRYGRDVVFYSAQKPSLYLAKKALLRNDVPVVFAGENVGNSDSRKVGPTIQLFDSTGTDASAAFELGIRLRLEHPSGCALVILDGWSTCAPKVADSPPAGGEGFPAERWPHAPLSRHLLVSTKQFAQTARMPVVMGVTTASLVDEAAQVSSLGIDLELRIAADRLLSLYRPAVYAETAKLNVEQRNDVALTGTSPQWWDTRCSKLRFDPRRMGFETAA